MAQPPPETPKHTRPPRSAPSSSSQRVPSSPASSRRPRPALSPLSTVQGPGPSHSFRTSTYQSSVRPPESISGLSLAPSRLTRVLTGTASQAGSTATGAHAGSTKFRRGHVRKRPGQLAAPAGSAVSSANPDEVDLMALEEPDDVFRAFGVRDVRRIEQRARCVPPLLVPLVRPADIDSSHRPYSQRRRRGKGGRAAHHGRRAVPRLALCGRLDRPHARRRRQARRSPRRGRAGRHRGGCSG